MVMPISIKREYLKAKPFYSTSKLPITDGMTKKLLTNRQRPAKQLQCRLNDFLQCRKPTYNDMYIYII